MDLDATAKSLSKRHAFSTKRIVFLAVVGLCVLAGILIRFGPNLGQFIDDQTAATAVPEASPPDAAPPAADATETVAKTPPPAPEAVTAPSQAAAPAAAPPATESAPAATPPTQEAATTPNEQAVPATGDAAHQEQPELPGSGMILVAKRPVELLASPSSSASVMYGFPAGRPFRVVGREGSFAKIQDLRSGASGWIDATALATPPKAPAVSPPRTQTYSAPSQSKPATVGAKPTTASADPKPKATKKATSGTSTPEAAAETETAQTPKRGGLFGQGGLFGGIFGNKNQP